MSPGYFRLIIIQRINNIYKITPDQSANFPAENGYTFLINDISNSTTNLSQQA